MPEQAPAGIVQGAGLKNLMRHWTSLFYLVAIFLWTVCMCKVNPENCPILRAVALVATGAVEWYYREHEPWHAWKKRLWTKPTQWVAPAAVILASCAQAGWPFSMSNGWAVCGSLCLSAMLLLQFEGLHYSYHAAREAVKLEAENHRNDVMSVGTQTT